MSIVDQVESCHANPDPKYKKQNQEHYGCMAAMLSEVNCGDDDFVKAHNYCAEEKGLPFYPSEKATLAPSKYQCGSH